MSFRDDVRRRKEELNAQLPPGASRRDRFKMAMGSERESHSNEREAKRREAAARFAPGAEVPFVDYLRSKEAKAVGLQHDLDILAEVYVAAVGIHPEDVYGIYPRDMNAETASVREMAITYRDKPEYERGREQFWQSLLQPE